jgi:hypothetical protein
MAASVVRALQSRLIHSIFELVSPSPKLTGTGDLAGLPVPERFLASPFDWILTLHVCQTSAFSLAPLPASVVILSEAKNLSFHHDAP